MIPWLITSSLRPASALVPDLTVPFRLKLDAVVLETGRVKAVLLVWGVMSNSVHLVRFGQRNQLHECYVRLQSNKYDTFVPFDQKRAGLRLGKA